MSSFNRKAVSGVVLIFLLGALAGAVGTYNYGLYKLRRALATPESFSRFIGDRLARRLDLDDAQREKLMAVVEKSHLRIKTIRKRITPELVEIFRDAGVEISSFLNPEQKEEFQAMVRRQRDHFIKGKPLEP